jgi:hypothetical protein
VLNWRAIDGQWTEEQGVLVGKGQWEARYVTTPGAPWQNYTFSGQFKFPEGESINETTLLFHILDIQPEQGREQDQGHYYQIAFLAQYEYVILFRVGYGSQELKRVSYPLKLNKWYQFQVEVSGSSVKLFIDNAPVLESDGIIDYSSGGIGVKTFWGSTGYFKDLRLLLK